MWNFAASALAALAFLAGAAAPQSSYPFADGERLYYEIAWPSGLSLGEASMSATLEGEEPETPAQWRFGFRLQSQIPGFAVSDTVRSLATDGFCSLELEKDLRHGDKRTRERTVFDAESETATRSNLSGDGVSEFIVDDCPKDALTFLYELRDQLARGRIPSPQTIYFGAEYSIEFKHLGRETVRVGETDKEGDHLSVTVTGPVSEHVLDVVIGRDEGRRLLRVEAPLELGKFSMQLLP